MRNDEYYTPYNYVERMLSTIDLTEYKVYCPCDQEWSNFVKYLKNGKCKELKYTWDDYNLHDKEFEWADVVITNPPFSQFTAFMNKLYEHNKKFIIIGHNLVSSVSLKYLQKGCRVGGPWIENWITDLALIDKDIKRGQQGTKRAPCRWYSNMAELDLSLTHVKWEPATEPDAWYTEHGKKLAHFRWNHVPEKWDDEFLVDCTYDEGYADRNLELLRIAYLDDKKVFGKLVVRIREPI